MPRLVVPIFACAFAQLALFIEHAVIGQHEMRAVADEQILSDHRHPILRRPSISATSATGSMTTPLPITQIFPRRRMPDGIRCRTYFVPPMNDGVPGVVAALAADDDVRLAGEDVDDFAFAFVAPLGADQNCVCHGIEMLGKKLSRRIRKTQSGLADER